MKLAISGKGGVGKSTLAAAVSILLARQGKKVLALDADPDANLAAALGFPRDLQQRIVPISQQAKLIEERTGAKIKQYGQMFKLNPEVSDISEIAGITYNDVSLLVLGAVQQGGSGCACPESVLIRSLVTDLVLYKDDALVMDMEAGVEHLGRATAKGVDAMLIVVEPGQRSLDCAHRVIEMAEAIGIPSVQIIANKITNDQDKAFILSAFPNHPPQVFIPYSEEIRQADQIGTAVTEQLSEPLHQLLVDFIQKLELELKAS